MSISKHTMSAGGGLAAAALIAMPAPALAHDSLTGSSPESGASSAEAPQGIDLTFSAARRTSASISVSAGPTART